MPKHLHACKVCNDDIREKGYKAYICELCPAWMHAKCLFPNASETKLRFYMSLNLL